MWWKIVSEVGDAIIPETFRVYRLNPCCGGRWSQSQEIGSELTLHVLILVVVEDGLRVMQKAKLIILILLS